MKQLPFISRKAAEDRSRAEWDKVRPPAERSPEDVTTMLWSVEETDDGKASVAVPEADETRLSKAERGKLVARRAIADAEARPLSLR